MLSDHVTFQAATVHHLLTHTTLVLLTLHSCCLLNRLPSSNTIRSYRCILLACRRLAAVVCFFVVHVDAYTLTIKLEWREVITQLLFILFDHHHVRNASEKFQTTLELHVFHFE